MNDDMSDRELLELAAKAAGYQPDGLFGKGLHVVTNAGLTNQKGFVFDPINDDGDALRLAVSCDIEVVPYPEGVKALYWNTRYHSRSTDESVDDHAGDKNAAARRAIVRAAAEIGKAMP